MNKSIQLRELTPIELRQHLLAALVLVLALGLTPVIWRGWDQGLWHYGLRGAITGATCWLAGCLLGPALLPWLPGRAFWVKGAFLGAALAAGLTMAGVVQGFMPVLGAVLWLGGQPDPAD